MSSSTTLFRRWSTRYPLFRVLLLLDATGLQVLTSSATTSGSDHCSFATFLQTSTSSPSPSTNFTESASAAFFHPGTAAAQLLQHSLRAFKENLCSLFSTRKRHGSRRGKVKQETDVCGDADEGEEEGSEVAAILFGDALQSAVEQQERLLEWESRVTQPTSLHGLEDAMGDTFSLSTVMRIHDAFCSDSLSNDGANEEGDGSHIGSKRRYCCDRHLLSRLVEQFLTDGLDAWLRASASIPSLTSNLTDSGDSPHVVSLSQSSEDPSQQPSSPAVSTTPSTHYLQRMVLACGGALSPTEVLPLLSTAEGVDVLVGFVLDVLFPVNGFIKLSQQRKRKDSDEAIIANDCEEQAQEEQEAVEVLDDWVLTAYMKNHEVLILGSSSSSSSDDDDDGEDETSPSNLRWKPSQDEETSGDLFVTCDNIDSYLRHSPHLLPRTILAAKRKRWDDASITVWELEHHYTATELKAAMRASLPTLLEKAAVEEAALVKRLLMEKKSKMIEGVTELQRRRRLEVPEHEAGAEQHQEVR